MIVVPAGSFVMGSPADAEPRYRNEGPMHAVKIARRFAVGVYEVTFAEWDACDAGGGCDCCQPRSMRPDMPVFNANWDGARMPVINVGWDEARRYVEWLSARTSERYRLPSEAEWEYVARAGTTTPFQTGSTISWKLANLNVVDRYDLYRGHSRTVPVGSYGANAWGLHDMHGNVSEWVQDCWHDSYAGAPTDGSAWVERSCASRVVRGGSWDRVHGDVYAWRMRSASDWWYLGAATRFHSNRSRNDIGFRVVRALAP